MVVVVVVVGYHTADKHAGGIPMGPAFDETERMLIFRWSLCVLMSFLAEETELRAGQEAYVA